MMYKEEYAKGLAEDNIEAKEKQQELARNKPKVAENIKLKKRKKNVQKR